MLHFENDYNEGAHPKLLEALIKTNQENLSGYGTDTYTKQAVDKIRQASDCPDAQVTFLVGGTQTNQVVIDTVLAPFEGVLAAETGHITTHEAGAIEFTGHKVLPLPQEQGKITAADVERYLKTFYSDGNYEHMVFPGMVYISQPTEYGALYTREELEALSQVCHQFEIPLYVDGARLGYALGSPENDVDLPSLAQLADIFYIGGTKLGALIGEALVFTKNNQPKQFLTQVKQHGALLAKGRVTGIQFDTFFTDGLYTKIGQEAIERANQLKTILKDKGYRFYYESPTNQQFVIVNNDDLEALAQKVVYSYWEPYDDHHTVIRLATSWSTTDADLAELANLL